MPSESIDALKLGVIGLSGIVLIDLFRLRPRTAAPGEIAKKL